VTLWAWIVGASLAAYAVKLLGYLVPRRWMDNERMTRIAGTMTIGLLASLTAVNALGTGQGLAIDARLGSLVAAAVALLLRAPFLVVVIVGAAVAAGLRLLGWG
jgi:uncharacterized membrane protein